MSRRGIRAPRPPRRAPSRGAARATHRLEGAVHALVVDVEQVHGRARFERLDVPQRPPRQPAQPPAEVLGYRLVAGAEASG